MSACFVANTLSLVLVDYEGRVFDYNTDDNKLTLV